MFDEIKINFLNAVCWRMVTVAVKIKILLYTVTSRLFMHIVSTEKMHKNMRDRKDTRGT